MIQYDYIVVVGPAKHGKSSVAAELALATGRTVTETGDFLAYVLARLERAKETVGVNPCSVERWLDYITANKSAYRGALRLLGDVLTEHQGDALMRGALQRSPRATIIVGVRRWCEVRAFNAHYAHNNRGGGVLFIEVFRPGRPVEQDSYELSHCNSSGNYGRHHKIIIYNDGDEVTLRQKVRDVVARQTAEIKN